MVRAIFTDVDPDEKVEEECPFTDEPKEWKAVGEEPFKQAIEIKGGMTEVNMAEIEQRVMASLIEPEKPTVSSTVGHRVEEFPGINQNMLEYFRSQMEQSMEGLHSAHSGRFSGSSSNRSNHPRHTRGREVIDIEINGAAEQFTPGTEHNIRLEGRELGVRVENASRTIEGPNNNVTTSLKLLVIEEN